MIYTSKQLLSKLAANHPRLESSGFWVAVEEIVGPDEIDEVKPFPKFIPDAFLVDGESMALNLYEIEVTHAMPEDKAVAIGRFADDMLDFGWDVNVFIVNRYGHETKLDVGDLYMHGIVKAAEGKQ